MNKREIWKPIKGYEGLYAISSFGRIKSFIYHRGSHERILKPRKVKDGYLMVALYKNKIRKNYQIHQLVAKSFIENPNNFNEINHKDFDKTNNCISNLEWIDHYSNILHYRNKFNKERRFV